MTKASKSAEPSRAVKLCGTEEIDAPSRKLSAGALTVELENGQLRYVAFKGVEALRGIAFLVRDQNWGTYTPRIEWLSVKEDAGSFTVEYKAICEDADQRLEYEARITGSSDGALSLRGGCDAAVRFRDQSRWLRGPASCPARRTEAQGHACRWPRGGDPLSRADQSIAASFQYPRARPRSGAWTVGDLSHGRRRVRDGGPAQLDRRFIQDLRAASRLALGIYARQREPARAVRAPVVHGRGTPAAPGERAAAIAIELGRDLPLRMPELGVALPNDEVEAASAAGDALRVLKPRLSRLPRGYADERGCLSVRKDQASRRSRSSENRPRDRCS